MGKQILIVLGGGRPRGNTAQLAEAFTRGAGAAGHTVETISLLKNEVKGCLGCNACRYGRPCVQRDAFHGRGMLPAGGCGDTNGPPRIGETNHLERAFAFGQTLYPPEELP